MKLITAAKNATFRLADNDGNTLLGLEYSDYSFELNIAKLIPAFGALIAQCAEQKAAIAAAALDDADEDAEAAVTVVVNGEPQAFGSIEEALASILDATKKG